MKKFSEIWLRYYFLTKKLYVMPKKHKLSHMKKFFVENSQKWGFLKKFWAEGRPSGRPFESAARPWPARRESGPEGAGPNAEGRPRPGRAVEMSGLWQP